MEYDLVSLGSRIYNARKNKNMTQGEICEILDMTQPTYSKLENGKYNINISLLYQISSILDVSLAWMVSGENSDHGNSENLQLDKNRTYIITIR
jgi:transcriptional regulator with XRE-family HTH domain